MQNGFSRKTSLVVMCLILVAVVAILFYIIFQSMKIGNDTLLHDSFDLLKALALVLFGGFVALIKDLFKDDTKITIADVKDIIGQQNEVRK